MRAKSVLSIFAFTAVVALAGPAFAEGDAAKGEKTFRKCKACHAVEAGKNKVGPSLHNLIGRTVGTSEGFKYSKAMVAFGESGKVWDEATLSTFLEKPKTLVKGTKMAFVGLKKPADRDNVIAYLKQFSE